MLDHTSPGERFEHHRPHVQAVAYRMLGSLSDADDAVQEAWLHVSRADTSEIENFGGWLTTVVARVCLDQLRARKARREDPLLDDESLAARPAGATGGTDPEAEALLAEAVGVALLVVLDALAPAERLAFVLHDVFAVPYDAIAPIVGRSPTAARQLASRARRRVQGAPAVAHTDHQRQREVVTAFREAASTGNFAALLTVLDPEVVLRADARAVAPGAPREVHGAAAVADGALGFSRTGRAQYTQLALINGNIGIVVAPRGRLRMVLDFTLRDGKIVGIDIIADRARLRRVDLAILADG